MRRPEQCYDELTGGAPVSETSEEDVRQVAEEQRAAAARAAADAWEQDVGEEEPWPEAEWHRAYDEDVDAACRYLRLAKDAGYRVRLGGSPPDSAEVYGSREEAEEAAVAMAREVAERDQDGAGYDPETVSVYGGPGDETGWGACPEGCDGAYYPEIEEII